MGGDSGLNGLERLRAMIAGEIPAPPIRGPMNFRLSDAGEGWAEFRGTPLPDHCNPAGSVHGGWYGTLLDSAMGCAVQSRLPAGQSYTTLEYKVNIVRPAVLGTEVIVTGRASHVGRRTGIATAEMTDGQGRLLATGSTTCMVFAI